MAAASFSYHRKPTTTQSQSRSCLTLSIVALVGLIGTGDWLGHNTVETSALEATEPIGSKVRIGRGGREMDRR